MRADVLQVVAICCHGNAYLSSQDVEGAPELVGVNRTFRAVHECVFERFATGVYGKGLTPVAAGTGPWLRRLRAEGVERIYLSLGQCALQNAEGENWGIVTDGNHGLELWRPAWKVRPIAFSDSPSWKIRYTAERLNRGMWRYPKPVAESWEELLRSVETALTFCKSNASYSMRAPLERCHQLQTQGKRETPGFPDLYHESMPLEAQKLCSAAMMSMLVICSSMWGPDLLTNRSAKEELGSLTDSIWRAAMTAFESATCLEAEPTSRTLKAG